MEAEMPDVATSLDDLLVYVPEERQPRFQEIVALTDRFCVEHLTDEYLFVCRLLATDIFQHDAPVERGKAESWACGIVHIIAQVNYLMFQDSDPRLAAEQIHNAFGVSSGTMYKWSRQIREGMQISDVDERFIVPSARESHPGLLALADLEEMQRLVGAASPRPEDIIAGFLANIAGRGGEAESELATPRSDLAYELKITLLGTDPPVWRRVQTPDCTLEELHFVIQMAMGWEDAHLHEFEVKGQRYQPEPPEDVPDWMRQENDGVFTSKVLLSDIVAERSRRFRFHYIYDFGDNWEHEIAVEKKLKDADAEAVKRPVCLEGARACPPEDSGGIWGYADLLRALSDPESAWDEELAEMFDGFDPDEFESKEINREFKRFWR
jgi:transposase-like protein